MFDPNVECTAIVVPQQGYEEELRDRARRSVSVCPHSYQLTEPLVPNQAGWAVALEASGCVQPALEYAFTTLRYANQTDRIMDLNDAFLVSACSKTARSDARVGLNQLGFVLYL